MSRGGKKLSVIPCALRLEVPLRRHGTYAGVGGARVLARVGPGTAEQHYVLHRIRDDIVEVE
jgi:hypothetical protein